MIFDEARDIVSDILRPFPYDVFFDEIVGRKPLVLSGEQSPGHSAMLGNDPRQAILNAYEKYAHTLTCHIRAPTTPPPTPRRVASAKAFKKLVDEYHQKGYTVRIPEVTNVSPKLDRLTRALEVVIGNPVGVVIFWSQTEAEAPVHDDEVDVIVIQLRGKKRWFISNDAPVLPNNWKQIGKREPALGNYGTYDVAEGDVIYLPRGTPHTVQSTSESIHLSIGFVPVTIREAISAVLDCISDLDRPLRTDLGTRADDLAGNQHMDVVLRQIREGVEKLARHSQSDPVVQTALAFRRARLMMELPKLSPATGQPQVTIESSVRHSPLATAQMIATPDILDFRQPGEQMLVHRGVETCLRFIAATPAFKVADIPGEIGNDVRVSLVQRLIGSGFLAVDS